MNKLVSWALTPVKKMVKKAIKEYIRDEQEIVIRLISEKVSLPNLSAVKERELITKLYDTLEEVVGEILDTI